jgi:DNA-binding cell septation regulator SpoVG
MLSHPAITFGVSVQPVIFAAIAKNERLRHSGFVDRFLFLLPPSRLGYRKLEQHPVPESLLDGWDRSVRDLAAVESLTDDEGEPTPHVLSFSAAAYGLWKAWQREVESMMREGGRLQHLAGWAGKLAGNTARIAGLLHCGERTFTAVAQREIQGDSVERAITLARVFLDHALVVFDLMGSDASSEGATALWGVITSRRDVEFSARDAWHPLRGKYKRVGDVEAGFQKLIDHNLIAEWGGGMAGKPGRPSRRFRVHPQVAEEWQ